MATLDNQQETWVPYETTKDCSQGFCSIYCPQWCYIIFPPPPPPIYFDDDSNSGTAFSPLVIAIIGILASAFLLVSYYTIISKYCGTFSALRRRLRLRHQPTGPDGELDEEDPGTPSRRHEAAGWHVSPSSGLDEALIGKIAMYRYRSGEGVIEGTDCSVCLSEFREDESLRLLPKCSHAFHLQCIDTWLRSHSNCPLCRANIVSAASPAMTQLPVPPPPPLPELATNASTGEGEPNDEMVLVIGDRDIGGEDENHLEDECGASKDPDEISYGITEIGDEEGGHPIRRSFSMGSSRRGRVSIADVLRVSMEDEFLAAKDQGLVMLAGCSRRCGGEQSKGSGSGSGSRSRALHCVMSPVPMKRSFSSGRFCFTRQGRGRNAVLPI